MKTNIPPYNRLIIVIEALYELGRLITESQENENTDSNFPSVEKSEHRDTNRPRSKRQQKAK
ncbi:MAG: hypothetical protein Fur0022_02610 [Anaerolineales bacterium]